MQKRWEYCSVSSTKPVLIPPLPPIPRGGPESPLKKGGLKPPLSRGASANDGSPSVGDWRGLGGSSLNRQVLEAVGNFTVFNIKGNDYRLIVGIDYENQVVYYKYFLTHAEYDKNKWKNDPYF
jgi:hypothetical protein